MALQMRPIDTSALPVSAQQALEGLPAELRATSGQDLAASLFGGDGDRVDLSPAAQALISGQDANERSVTDAAHAIGLAEWPG